jgi:hypothetical protein
MTAVSRTAPAPLLPAPRGPISEWVLRTLCAAPSTPPRAIPATAYADPLGDDAQLALYVCYELHYRGFHAVDPAWEWDPELLRLRGALEASFLDVLRESLPGGRDVPGELDQLLVEPVHGTSVSHHLRESGSWPQMREYLAHRSLYQLKEADPHLWVVPRLEGAAKAALMAVEFDEFGAGRAERIHARLFAELMAGAGLDPTYGRYLDSAPAVTLATVNLMSLFGLHRALRAALVGHFAWLETTSPPAARRLAQALERLGAGPECTRFYTEHVEADAAHEQVMRHEVLGDLLRREPDLAADVVLGLQATTWTEDRLADHLLTAWHANRSSLRDPAKPAL